MALDKIEIGERVRKIREEIYQETREIFAERCGLSENQLGKIERGNLLVTTNVLDKISSVTGVDTDYLLYGKGSNRTWSIRRTIENFLDRSSKEELEAYFKFISIIKSKFVLKGK